MFPGLSFKPYKPPPPPSVELVCELGPFEVNIASAKGQSTTIDVFPSTMLGEVAETIVEAFHDSVSEAFEDQSEIRIGIVDLCGRVSIYSNSFPFVNCTTGSTLFVLIGGLVAHQTH